MTQRVSDERLGELVQSHKYNSLEAGQLVRDLREARQQLRERDRTIQTVRDNMERELTAEREAHAATKILVDHWRTRYDKLESRFDEQAEQIATLREQIATLRRQLQDEARERDFDQWRIFTAREQIAVLTKERDEARNVQVSAEELADWRKHKLAAAEARVKALEQYETEIRRLSTWFRKYTPEFPRNDEEHGKLLVDAVREKFEVLEAAGAALRVHMQHIWDTVPYVSPCDCPDKEPELMDVWDAAVKGGV